MAILRSELAGMDFSDVATDERLPHVTPGDVLLHDFMEPLGLSARALAAELGVPSNRISEIVAGNRTLTADTALRLEKRFGNSARFWLGLQVAHELEAARDRMAAA